MSKNNAKTATLNKYAAIINARVEARKKESASDKLDNNTANMIKLMNLVSYEKVEKYLDTINADASMLNDNIYALNKIREMLSVMFYDSKKMQDFHACVTRTVLLHVKNDKENITSSVLKLACTKNNVDEKIVLTDELKALVYQRNEVKDARTCDTQASSSSVALRFFKILDLVSRKERVNFFKINKDADALAKMQEFFA